MTKKTSLYIVLVIINCLSFNVKAQTTEIDSLENLLQHHIVRDTVRVNLLNDFAEAIKNIDQEKSIKYAEEALELANMLDFKEGKALSLYCLGFCHYLRDDYLKSREYWQKSLYEYEALGNKLKVAKCLDNIGMIYYKLGNYPLALECCHKALKINEEDGNKLEEVSCLNNFGLIYYRQGNYPLSLEYFQKALKRSKEFDYKRGIASCLNNIGMIYEKQANYKMALSYYQEALKINEKINGKQNIAYCSNNIGVVYEKQKNYTLALAYYQKALKILEKIGDKWAMAGTMNNIGVIYYNQSNFTLALDYYQKALKIGKEINEKSIILDSYTNLGSFYLKTLNFKKAINYTQKSLLIARELELLDEQKHIYFQMSEIYTATKNYKKALENYILYKELNDSIFNEENTKKITGLEYQYEFEKEKQAIELEQQKKDVLTAEKSKRQKTVGIALIIGFILMSSFVVIILRSFIQKRKAHDILAKQKIQIEETNKMLNAQKKVLQNVAFKLEEANETKDKFFSIIAHDLKSPFGSLMGFSDLLLRKYTILDDEKRDTYLKFINEGTIKIYRLLENLLTWAQAQTGIIKFTPEKINISVLLTETILLFEEPARNKKIKLLLIDEKNLSINADKNMIDTVLRNLISNAIKFTPKGGDISVKSEIMTDENGQKFVEISVKDSGVGIPKETQSMLFKLTENITTKGTEEETGTGLGLILCKEFIEKHSGTIWVESEVEKGCKFVFRIPLTH